jgi:eukaryotic-like serine/threonine-protein kinase
MQETPTTLRERFGRYRVQELLGQGAHGLVFAVEGDDGERVALKVLRAGPSCDAELKREFRCVADLIHPNLVLPYGLETDGAQVFFTMELVRGSSILEWLDEQPTRERAERIRDALRQCALGLIALHQRGLLHRDVKPSNILVEANGRVAIVDFGLVREVETGVDAEAAYFAGTPPYLAPELIAGEPASPAADAYALGVVLHQALCGRLPFHEDPRQSIRLRMGEAPPEVSAEPDDLARICRSLLHPRPAERLGLRGLVAELDPGSAPAEGAPAVPILGRDQELDLLEQSYERTATERRPLVVSLPGHSGMGKSTLLRAFARRMRDRAWVLEGKAYEHDTVPYKALDAAMDQLAERLFALPSAERAALAPSEPEALRVLFPALAAALGAGVSDTAEMTPVARRRWGVRALRELLANVSARFGLIVTLDDLHWGDLDSARLLIDLLTAPVPPFLVALAYRAERADAPFLSLYRRWAVDNVASETIPVNPLSEEGAMRLAEQLHGASTRAHTIARESEGCPFLIEVSVSAASTGERASFEDAVVHRTSVLTDSARHMLEAVALAARPLPRGSVPFTPDHPNEARAAWAALINGRLLRSGGSSPADPVEVYHDRIRHAVATALSPDGRRSTHRALGESLATIGDAEGAALHLAAAGERARAFTFARRAADAAMSTLAFDRAAQILSFALECCPSDRADVRLGLVRQRARALANAGRGAEAAPLFLECADRSSDLEATNLRREAMEQYLVAGRLDEGRPVMKRLLEDLGVWHPRSSWLAKASLYAEIGRLLLRGPVVRAGHVSSPRERVVLETFLSIGKGFASYDTMLGSWFFVRAARRALDAGEPKVAVRAMAYTASLLGFSGSEANRERADKWLSAGEALAARHGDGHALAFCQVARGMIECCAGEWRQAVATFAAAAQVLDSTYAASTWEADTAKSTSLFALVQLCDLRELDVRANALTREARTRGDLALEVDSNLPLALVALGRDSVQDAHRCIDRNLELWTAEGYHFQHWHALRFRTLALLYAGACDEALGRLDHEVPRAREANLTSMQVVRVEALDLEGRAALGAAARVRGRRRAALLARVARAVERLEREKRPHALAPAAVLRAGISHLGGDRERASRHLDEATATYALAFMTTHALTSSWLLARIAGDRARAERIAGELAGRGVAAPTRWARMHLGLEVE